MKALVIGSGGREHSIVHALSLLESRPDVLCAPGNGGTAMDGRNLPAPSTSEGFDSLIEAATAASSSASPPDLTIVGPEAPLVEGIVEAFEARGLRIFGPNAEAARLEGSKCFSKEFLARHGIPTASFRIFDEPAPAKAYLETVTPPIVVKADGLAAGKGVFVARDRREAIEAVEAILVERRFGDAGNRIIIEECLEGSEISFFIICDGDTYVPLETAQDYKPVRDGDQGPNTGGMGSYSPYLRLDDPRIVEITEKIVAPTVEGLKKDGITYRGVLYIGLMLTRRGAEVLEFNVRLGDPETQVLLPRLRTSFVEVAERAIDGRLGGFQLEWDPRHAVTVVAASEGYPASYPKGREITGIDSITDPDVKVFHAGTNLDADGRLVTTGGRVLAVTALGAGLDDARRKAYDALSHIRFEGLHHRSDIAAGGR